VGPRGAPIVTRMSSLDTAHATRTVPARRSVRVAVRTRQVTSMSPSPDREGAEKTAAMAAQKWPSRLWIVRHGQSAGNVARDAAELAQQPWIDIATRDVDTPLSELGEEQARALGKWFAALPARAGPTVVLASHRDFEIERSCERERIDDVGHAGTARDDGRILVNQAVVHAPALVVTGILALQ